MSHLEHAQISFFIFIPRRNILTQEKWKYTKTKFYLKIPTVQHLKRKTFMIMRFIITFRKQI